MAKKSKALFVCSQIPSRTAQQAGHKTAFQYLFDLSKNYSVDLIIICKAGDLPLDIEVHASLNALAGKIDIVSLSSFERSVGLVLGLFMGLSPRFSTRISIGLILLFFKTRRGFKYEMVWLEFSQSFWLSLFIGGAKEVLMSAHDVQTQVVSRKNKLETFLMLGWTYLSEKRILRSATTIRVQSTKDAEFISEVLQPDCPIEISAPVLSEFIYSVQRLESRIEPFTMLFWGAMSRAENSGAIINFIKNYLPSIKEKYPRSKLYVVGSNPTHELYSMAEKWKETVVITGFIENPSEYFEICSVGIAPLLSGAGVKVKVLEMLGAKMPVIATPIASEGIVKNPLLYTVPLTVFEDELGNIWSKLDG